MSYWKDGDTACQSFHSQNLVNSIIVLNVGGQSFAVPRTLLQQSAEDRVYTPEKGTSKRKAILGAVRAKLKTREFVRRVNKRRKANSLSEKIFPDRRILIDDL